MTDDNFPELLFRMPVVIHCYSKRIAENGFRFLKGASVLLKIGNGFHCIPNKVHVIAPPAAGDTYGCGGAAPGRVGMSARLAAGTTLLPAGRLRG